MLMANNQTSTGLKVLVVDDEVDVTEVIAFLLEDAGYIVEVKHSADLALEEVKNHSYDFILTDYNLPGLSGQEYISRLRGSVSDHSKIFVVSGTSVHQFQNNKDLVSLVDGFLDKPFKLDKLLNILK